MLHHEGLCLELWRAPRSHVADAAATPARGECWARAITSPKRLPVVLRGVQETETNFAVTTALDNATSNTV
jgi:hypothetical protein